MEDTRNLIDAYKGKSNEQVFSELEKQRTPLEIAIENNVDRAKPLHDKKFIQNTTLIFGSENSGISPELLVNATDVRFIESFGSTRSVNVGAAAAIAMYEWTRQTIFQTEVR